jgi:low temperature requirement protein LtrA
MVAVVAMGINLHPAYHGDISLGFDIAYLVFRTFHFLMYLLAHFSEGSPITLQSIIFLPIFSIPYIVALFRPDLTYILWPLAAIAEEILHWARAIIGAKISRSWTVPISIEHLTERNGLFVMIILGETVAGSMFRKSMEGEIIGWQFYVASALGLLIAFSIQWIYFDTEVRKI